MIYWPQTIRPSIILSPAIIQQKLLLENYINTVLNTLYITNCEYLLLVLKFFFTLNSNSLFYCKNTFTRQTSLWTPNLEFVGVINLEHYFLFCLTKSITSECPNHSTAACCHRYPLSSCVIVSFCLQMTSATCRSDGEWTSDNSHSTTENGRLITHIQRPMAHSIAVVLKLVISKRTWITAVTWIVLSRSWFRINIRGIMESWAQSA